jgi:hypothetical protein
MQMSAFRLFGRRRRRHRHQQQQRWLARVVDYESPQESTWRRHLKFPMTHHTPCMQRIPVKLTFEFPGFVFEFGFVGQFCK